MTLIIGIKKNNKTIFLGKTETIRCTFKMPFLRGEKEKKKLTYKQN